MKRFEIGNSIVLVLILIVLLTFTTMFNSHEIALGVISSCGTKLKVSIMGLPDQKGNASAIVVVSLKALATTLPILLY
ncbi:hypothetical protein [Nitrososphaera sp. AFS]|uniref:hypothetical protein n=1 Tax=Nitrososphaera sp. AFS TaxID=2301191 RepID=UPI0013922661|nr:hypothetical protein [Nitrososphaera sp. AFS]